MKAAVNLTDTNIKKKTLDGAQNRVGQPKPNSNTQHTLNLPAVQNQADTPAKASLPPSSCCCLSPGQNLSPACPGTGTRLFQSHCHHAAGRNWPAGKGRDSPIPFCFTTWQLTGLETASLGKNLSWEQAAVCRLLV